MTMEPDSVYTPQARVETPDGMGTVIKDCCLTEENPYPMVWVLLDSGDNPQRYRPEELS